MVLLGHGNAYFCCQNADTGWNMSHRITAIIPAFNEHERIVPIVDEAKRYVNEVIIVDDGSDEDSYRFLETLKDRTIVLRHRINLGKGSALRTGIAAAIARHADVIVLMDADGQHKPSDIPRLVEALEEKQVDIVFGSRKIGGSMPAAMRLGNHFFSVATNLLFRIYVSDTQSGFRAFRAAVYPKLEWQSPRYAAETEMVVNAGKHRLRHCEVPIDTIYHDKYKGTTVFDGIRIFLSMLLWRFS